MYSHLHVEGAGVLTFIIILGDCCGNRDIIEPGLGVGTLPTGEYAARGVITYRMLYLSYPESSKTNKNTRKYRM